ncbi:MAG TPA: rhomboid family intramembrane serine protease [Baekduia sp.]|uniref:rhomboid family intramembrane serine protease n=1 Tax=Baekduia sp. TaxID=2600305 RepID=UPI002D784CAD|nr:rhomboid family intramembrane serine protease [Baekduia sp.]HET6506869.1 rhomboid family intramembrane serine protease [Baekduia sp.]
MATCYRHPNRETGVSCSNCGRPICPDCMTPTPVGMRCPECAKQKTKVRNAAHIRAASENPVVTMAIIVVCVVLFLAEGGGIGLESTGTGWIYEHFALQGITTIHFGHDYWRLVTSGFLHAGLLHIGFNMYLLYLLGRQLEPAIGSRRFATVYFTALLVGSFGALVQTSTAVIVGASGAVFGLMGYVAYEQWRRGFDPLRGGIGGLILINLVIGFIPSFNIAVGAHIGGLITGVITAWAFSESDKRRAPWAGYALCALLIVGAVIGSIAVSGNLHNYKL